MEPKGSLVMSNSIIIIGWFCNFGQRNSLGPRDWGRFGRFQNFQSLLLQRLGGEPSGDGVFLPGGKISEDNKIDIKLSFSGFECFRMPLFQCGWYGIDFYCVIREINGLMQDFVSSVTHTLTESGQRC